MTHLTSAILWHTLKSENPYLKIKEVVMGWRRMLGLEESTFDAMPWPTQAPVLKTPVTTSAPTQPTSAMSEQQVARVAPGKLNLYKSAGLTLRKKGLLGERVAAYLVADRSASMNQMYNDGTVQTLADRVLSLSAHFDDDGIVPTWLFGSDVVGPFEVDIAASDTAVADIVRQVPPMGETNYAKAIKAVCDYHMRHAPDMPGFVIFQTDGDASDSEQAKRAITKAAGLPIFWQFVGFGGASADSFRLLNELNDMEGRVIDNGGFWWAGRRPEMLSDDEVFDGLMNELPEYLAKVRR